MPAHKSHHFVPRFYLRNFTVPEREKSISLYNIEKRRLVMNAPIKGQCCRDYFYGKNLAVEHGLAEIEGMVATLFQRMLREQRMPNPFTAGHLILCLHIVMQHGRTQYSGDALNEMMDGMIRATFRGHPEISAAQLDSVRFGYDDPALITTGMAMEFFPIVMDLKIGALLCSPGNEFLTSDNPVVMYNQYFNWRTYAGNTGLGSKGLQIFFPVWPWLTVVLYDKDVYHFGDSKNSVVALATPQDVHELNVMQAVSASENLYMFGSSANVFAVADDAARFRRKQKTKTVLHEQPSKRGVQSAIIATRHEEVRTDAVLSFMKIHKRAKRWLNEFKSQRRQPAVVARNPALMAKLDLHHEEVRAGRARREDTVRSVFGVSISDGTY